VTDAISLWYRRRAFFLGGLDVDSGATLHLVKVGCSHSVISLDIVATLASPGWGYPWRWPRPRQPLALIGCDPWATTSPLAIARISWCSR